MNRQRWMRTRTRLKVRDARRDLCRAIDRDLFAGVGVGPVRIVSPDQLTGPERVALAGSAAHKVFPKRVTP